MLNNRHFLLPEVHSTMLYFLAQRGPRAKFDRKLTLTIVEESIYSKKSPIYKGGASNVRTLAQPNKCKNI